MSTARLAQPLRTSSNPLTKPYIRSLGAYRAAMHIFKANCLTIRHILSLSACPDLWFNFSRQL